MALLNPGKMIERFEQILSTLMQIIVLEEIRCKEHGQIKKHKYSLYDSCYQQVWGSLELDLW
jgi:hypothetical protein